MAAMESPPPFTAPTHLRGAPRQPIPILMYHEVGPPPAAGSALASLFTPPERFAQQMRLLGALGFRALSMAALEPYLRGEAQGRVVGLTLDDGYRGCIEHVLPVLNTYGFSATCYVVSAQLGKTNAWDEALGLPSQPLMDAQALRTWIAAGQDVGGHTRHHVRLLRTDDDRARDEIAGCRHELEDLLQAPVRHFSYPYGEYGPQHLALAREAGWVTATTNVARRVTQRDALHALPRFAVFNDTSLTRLAWHVSFGTERLREWLRSVQHGTQPTRAGSAA
jgi:peptidoglycan/xylan/chitin deacetylase (PgdA/CDA1 family)